MIITGKARRILITVLLSLLIGVRATNAQTPDQVARWTKLNDAAVQAYRDGRYSDGIAAAEQALTLARQAFGPRHPDTLQGMNSLAELYQRQGRHSEAEPLFAEVLQVRREVLGPRHPDTLQSMNGLAALYLSQGRHGEAEPLF